MKVLIIKRDKLGDMLLTTPLITHLKASDPGGELHLLANDYNAWVVAGNADVDRVHCYRRVRHAGRASISAAVGWLWLRQRLRSERFDWVLVANGDESRRAIERGLGVKGARTVAYCAEPGRYPALTHPLAPNAGAHEADRLMAMLAPLGITPPAQAILPRYVLPEAASAFADTWLREKGLEQRSYIVLGLGARRPKKQPCTAQVLRWAAHWKEAHGLDTVFMWTPGGSNDPLYPGDDATAQPVLDAGLPFLHPFRGPIVEALGLIWAARTSLFPDSGLMHFAAASPGGVLGFFAETDVSPSPAQWAPRGVRTAWLEAARSVSELGDEAVLEQVSRLLA